MNFVVPVVNHHLLDQTKHQLNRELKEVNLHNTRVFQNNVGKFLKSEFKLPDSVGFVTFENFQIHKQTYSSNQTTAHLLKLFRVYTQAFPFLDLYIDRFSKTRVIQKINWDIYRQMLEKDSATGLIKPEIRSREKSKVLSPVLKQIDLLNRNNRIRIKRKLRQLLKKPDLRTISLTQGVYPVKLASGTFCNPMTNNPLREKLAELREEFPFVEFFHVQGDMLMIRVYWKLFYQLLSTGEYQPCFKLSKVKDKDIELEQGVELGKESAKLEQGVKLEEGVIQLEEDQGFITPGVRHFGSDGRLYPSELPPPYPTYEFKNW